MAPTEDGSDLFFNSAALARRVRNAHRKLQALLIEDRGPGWPGWPTTTRTSSSPPQLPRLAQLLLLAADEEQETPISFAAASENFEQLLEDLLPAVVGSAEEGQALAYLELSLNSPMDADLLVHEALTTYLQSQVEQESWQCIERDDDTISFVRVVV